MMVEIHMPVTRKNHHHFQYNILQLKNRISLLPQAIGFIFKPIKIINIHSE